MADVLRDKLAVPLVPWFAVERPELEERLDAALQNKVVLISAPTGFGKSVLAAQYARKHPDVPLGWLHVDRGDNDARRLAAHLVAAVGTGVADFGASSLERLTTSTEGLGPEFVDELGSELRARPPLLLVIDELEAVTDRVIRSELLSLLQSAPPHVHVLIITRTDPQLPLHRLRMVDGLVEIRQEDLAFDLEGARELVQRVAGREIDPAQAATIHDLTEGWPAALQVVGLALRDAGDPDAVIASFSAGNADLERYLAEEVLAGLEPDLEDFLVATSVLPRMNGALCDAVTGGTGSDAVLRRLQHDALFVTPTVDEPDWFRYHSLFRTALRRRLHLADADRERDVLRRAAAWHLDRGQVDDAVPFLLSAEDWDDVIELVRAHGGPYFRSGRAATVLTWLVAIPEHVRQADPLLAIEHAALTTMAGSSLVAEQQLAAVTATTELSAPHRLVAASIMSSWVEQHAPPEPVMAWCDDALAELPRARGEFPDLFGLGNPSSVAAVLRANRGRALLYLDRGAEAIDALTQLEVHLRDEEGTGPWLVNVEGTLAMADAWAGRLRASEERYHRAVRHMDSMSTVAHPSLAHAQLGMGQVLLERGELARAEILLGEGSRVASQQRREMPVILHSILLCRLALALNEPERALDEFDRLRAQGFTPFPPAVSARASAVHLQALLAAGQGKKAFRLFEGRPAPITGPMFGAAAAVLVHAGRHDEALRLLDASTPAAGDDRAAMERDLWLAIVIRPGDAARSRALVDDVLDRAEVDGHVRLFTDAGAPAMQLLRDRFEREPTPFLRRLVGSEEAPGSPSAAANRSLVEPLSERELVVLSFLATRLSNHEIAERLYISVNTLKTHLRHVYEKLGVNDRRGALTAAESIGLI